MTTTQKLMDMQERVESLDKTNNQASGALEVVRTQLKEEFGCTGVKDATTKITANSKELLELDEEIEEGLTELDEEIEELENSLSE